MTLSLYAQPPALYGRLDRGGKTWRLPVTEDLFHLTPVDELFTGDVLNFPEIHSKRTKLLLRVVFTAGQMFRGLCPERSSIHVGGSYTLPAQCRCPMCTVKAVHTVTICDECSWVAGGAYWTFTRTCKCGASWFQDGRARYLSHVTDDEDGTPRYRSRYRDLFDDDLPA